MRHRAGERAPTLHHYPTNQLSRRVLAYEPERIPLQAFTLPDKAVLDDFVDAFFKYINPAFPLIDEDVFMAQYRDKSTESPSLLVMQVVCLIGAHVTRPRTERDELKSIFYRNAKTLFDARFEQDRNDVVVAAILMTFFHDGPEDIGANTWFWIGIAVRTALGLGMHRDPGPSNLIAHDKRAWRRVWWLLFQCDVLVALSFGRPQAL